MVRRGAAVLAALALCAAAPEPAPRYEGPIIDVHLHGYSDANWETVPIAATTNFLTPEELASPSPGSAAEHRRLTIAALREAGVTHGFLSFDTRERPFADEVAVAKLWRGESAGRVTVGVSDHALVAGVTPAAIETQVRAGVFTHLGELGLQYHGLSPNDPSLEHYWALAEKLDLPVGIHMGAAAPETVQRWPKFRMRLGSPLLLEEVLVRHPKMRVYFQHGGWPHLGETKAILEQYPNVRLDISAINWVLPPDEFCSYLEQLVTAGFADRIMFGSDQMMWPQAIAKAIRNTDRCALTAEQKRMIFHDNAAKFFRIKD
jgi:uncharacterized protein